MDHVNIVASSAGSLCHCVGDVSGARGSRGLIQDGNDTPVFFSLEPLAPSRDATETYERSAVCDVERLIFHYLGLALRHLICGCL